LQRNQISCDCPRVPKRSKCGIPELKCGISDRSETGTNTGLEAYIHIQAQHFIFFGAVNGVIRLVFISYIKNIPLISLGHCCVYLPSTDNLILFLLSNELTFWSMCQEFKQFTPRILLFSALSCRQNTELINTRRRQCLSIMHPYISYETCMRPCEAKCFYQRA
jgi:hypothetical protein